MNERRQDAQRPRQTVLGDADVQALHSPACPKGSTSGRSTCTESQFCFFDERMREHRFGYGRSDPHRNALASFQFREILRQYSDLWLADLTNHNGEVFDLRERRTRNGVATGYLSPVPQPGERNLQFPAYFG